MIKMHKDEFVIFLKKTFLHFLTNDEMLSVYDSVSMVEIEPFQKFNREEPPQFLYFIFSGDILLKNRSTQQEISQINSGQSIELKALFMKFPQWQYEWTSDDYTHLVKIPWNKIEPLFVKYPDRISYISKLLQSVSLQKLKKDLVSLQFTEEFIFQVISNIKLISFKDIVDFNLSQMNTLINLAIGELDIYELINNKYIPVNSFRAGDTLSFNSTDFKFVSSPEVRFFILKPEDFNSILFRNEYSRLLKIYQIQKEKKSIKSSQNNKVLDISSSTISMDAELQSLSKPKLQSLSSSNPSLKSPPASQSDFINFFSQKNTLIATEEYRTHAYIISILLKKYNCSLSLNDFESQLNEYYFDLGLFELRRKLEKSGFKVELKNIIELSDLKLNNTVNSFNTEGFLVLPQSQFYIVHTLSGFALIEIKKITHLLEIIYYDTKKGIVHPLTEFELNTKMKFSQCIHVIGYQKRFESSASKFDFKFCWNIVKDKKSFIFLSFFCVVVSYILSLSTPIVTQYIMDQVVQFGKADKLPILILLLAGLTLYSVFIDWYGQRLNTYLVQILNLRIKSFLNQNLFNQNNFKSHLHTHSIIITRLGEIENISQYFFTQYLPSVIQVVLLLSTLFVISLYSKFIAFTLFVFMPLSFLGIYLLKNKIINVKLEYLRSKTNETQILTQVFTALESLKALKLNLQSRWKIELIQNFVIRYNLKNTFLQSAFQIIQLFKTEFLRVITFVISLQLYVKDQLTLGQVLALTMLAPRLSSQLQNLMNCYFQYFSIKVMCEKLNEVISWPDATTESLKSIETLSDNSDFKIQELSCKNLSFSFNPQAFEFLIKNISYTFQKGTSYCITGLSGSGKSTLAYLLAGVYQPVQGHITINDQSSDFIKISEQRRIILVEQSSQLFAGTLLSNITLDDPNPDLKKVTECLKYLNIEEELVNKAGGLQYVIYPQGFGVNPSLRSKLLVARALYQDPDVLILDEATCYFDPITEMQFLKNLKPLFKDKILIYLSQKISVASFCDEIIYMKEGTIVESGQHKDLLALNGEYLNTFFKYLTLS